MAHTSPHASDHNTQRANATYIRTSMAAPMLERGHEQDLARRWRDQQDEKALHELVSSYARLVVAIASKFRHYGLPLADLIQEGNIGLMQAANRFEPERDVRFSTYASWWIKSAIQDHVLRNWSIVRTGTTAAHKALFFNLRRLKNRIEGAVNANGALTAEGRAAIAKTMGVAERDIVAMEGRLSGPDQSLNAVIGEDGEEERQSFLADTRPNPEDVVMGMKDAQSRSAWLNKALSTLNDRERHIIRQRHLDQQTVTLEDLGKSLGVSKERVRQIEARAMEKLKLSLSPDRENYMGA